MNDSDIKILIIKVGIVVFVLFMIIYPYLDTEGVYREKGYGGLARAITMIAVIVIYLYVEIKNIGKKK